MGDNTEIGICPVCDGEFVARTGKRGRPRNFCDSECAEAFKLIGWLTATMDKMGDKLANMPEGFKAANRLRREITGMANATLNKAGTYAGNNPAAVRAAKAADGRN